ncbi:MAG: DNA-3-methyladenine glycosylase [Planctomycetaceae bacterium]|nr:DNA-3-methyladenine glycosylase [Planctomycetaceae bacterium]
MLPTPLPASFYERSTVALARALIGTFLVHDAPDGRRAGRIVETEAYPGARDPASHSFRGETARNRSMFGPPGTLYVYFIYGMHHCANVVSAPEGVGEAVLLRALEPVDGVARMISSRGAVPFRDLCRGPGRLSKAMGLGPALDGASLLGPPLYLAPRDAYDGYPARPRIETGPRIGIRLHRDAPWRFWEAGSRFVSGTGSPRAHR